MDTTSTTSKGLTKKQKTIVGASALLSGALFLAGSLAYFTDHETASVTGKAGTVDLAITEAWQDVANFNPGDKAELDYRISNNGNKSIDVRETIVVKSNVALSDAAQAEFEIYHADDVTADANGAYIPNPGAEPITQGAERVLSGDKTAITYSPEEFVLNGTGANAETEAGVTETSKDMEYVLVFKDSASNAFQGADVTVELLAEAKQHRNTGDDTWVTIAQEDITVGGQAVTAVPQR